jgi:hypothetical protein
VQRARRWTAISALAGFVLFAAANALWAFEQPDPGSSGQSLDAFYSDLSERIVIGGFGSLLSLAVLVVFAGGLRTMLAELAGDDLLANVAFGGMILGLAAGLAAESINMAAAVRAGDGDLTEPVAVVLFDVSYIFGSYGAGIGFGVAMLAIGATALRSGALLPRWVAQVAIAVGFAMVTPLAGYLLGEYTVGPCFVIVAVLGLLLLNDRREPVADLRR